MKITEIFFFYKREGFLSSILKFSDFFLRPFGISLFSLRKFNYYGLKKSDQILFGDKNIKKIFTDIYSTGYWKKKYSLSGGGSEISEKNNYVIVLKNLIKEFNFLSIFDVPCGDMTWMRFVIKDHQIKYIGGDIVSKLIEENKKNFKELNFIEFDIINNQNYPDVDLIHIRDCFFHFSLNDIFKSINCLKKSKIKYVLLTSHRSMILKNFDIKTGDFRYLDFEKKPFNFPKPKKRLKDFKLGEFPKYVNLWEIEKLPFLDYEK